MPEQQQLIVHESQAIAPTQQAAAESVAMIQMLERAARDPQCDPVKMDALLQMQERIMSLRARQEFFSAKARVQPKLPRVARLDKNHTGNYAKLERIDEACRQILADEGFSVSYDTEHLGNLLKIIITVSHIGGHQDTGSITLPFDSSGSKNATQAVGSTDSYGKRYAFCNYWNIITVDADNDGAGEPITLDQVNKINDLLISLNADRKKFCEVLKVSEVEQIQRGQYQRALELIDRKAKQARQ